MSIKPMPQKKNRLLCIVPAYNEASNILGVLTALNRLQIDAPYDVAVINDGSLDNTSALVQTTQNAIVIDLPVNVGIGAAVQTGFIYADRNHYSWALQFDGDGQHPAEEIGNMLKAIQELNADMVIGSRFLEKNTGYQSSWARRIGIKIFEWVNRLLLHQRITDNTSGFRIYNERTIKFLAENYPHDFPEPEAVLVLGQNGFKISEIPVKMLKRRGGKSSISGIKTVYYMIKVLLSLIVGRFRPRQI